MKTTRHPYELLIRWAPDGTIAGAHVQWRYAVVDDAGAMIGETFSSAIPADKGLGDGFPLQGVLTDRTLAELAPPL
ncbi:hypothetical protein FBY14_12016 [Azospirillum brasilense]|nr:hypothetical protein FBY14_12016 [Azospirillum brasilense]